MGKFVITIIIIAMTFMQFCFSLNYPDSEKKLNDIRNTQITYISNSKTNDKQVKESDRIYKKTSELREDLNEIKRRPPIIMSIFKAYDLHKINNELDRLDEKSNSIKEEIQYNEAIKNRKVKTKNNS
ncbi:hypothetical protein CF067_17495 [Clostridium sporogenes]|uniref:Uncharacterized protein n=1 Tax=Clostridium botulinum B str. Osaka05 TaxID=1407017 RepID=A0A060N991_CLOBO|nr:hypothetical protein [Clostridium botulinum]BAO05243.1 uncharacterized protein CBO05P2_218 [Clostridium botulinum B str. Osaka05]